MSTRGTIWLPTRWLHIFRDAFNPGIYADIGHGTYNRAYQIWPPTFRRLY